MSNNPLKKFTELSNFQQWALFYLKKNQKMQTKVENEINNFCDTTKNNIDLNNYDQNMSSLQGELLYFHKMGLIKDTGGDYVLTKKGELYCFQNLEQNLVKLSLAHVLAGIIGGAIVAIFLIGIVAYAELFYDDARLAELIATYFPDQDRLAVAVILHNADGEFTKANGHLELTIIKNNFPYYTNEYDFTKNDFLTWDNLFLGKQRGVPIIIDKRFSNGDYDVYVNLKTNSGKYWEGLHTTFYSTE